MFKVIVILLFVVQGSEAYLPTPPSWPKVTKSVLLKLFPRILTQICCLSTGYILVKSQHLQKQCQKNDGLSYNSQVQFSTITRLCTYCHVIIHIQHGFDLHFPNG